MNASPFLPPVPPAFPLLPITSDATLRKCKSFPCKSCDIFIASYPKSGTTWTQNIVYQLLAAAADVAKKDRLNKRRTEHGENEGKAYVGVRSNGGSRSCGESALEVVDTQKDVERVDLSIEHISDVAPFYEADRTWDGEGLAARYEAMHARLGRRIFNTHLLWGMLPGTGDEERGEGAEGIEREEDSPCYLYVVRDGRDACVSFFHHMKSMAKEDGGFEGDFSIFFQEWLEGRLAYGRWTDHVAAWMGRERERGRRRNVRVLVVRYEDLKADLTGELKRIARHCGIDVGGGIGEKGEEVWEAVREKCSFEYMATNRRVYEPRSVTWRDRSFRFMRKGAVGDYRQLFTEDQCVCFAEAVREAQRKSGQAEACLMRELLGGEEWERGRKEGEERA